MGFTRNVSWIFGGKVTDFLLSLSSGIIIARVLGPEGKGVLALVTLIPMTLYMFLNLGLPKTNVYFLSSNKINLRQALSLNLLLFSAISTISLVIYFVLIILIRDGFLSGIGMGLLALAAFLLPLQLFRNQFGALLQARQLMRQFALISVASSTTDLLILLVALYILRLSVLGVLIATITSTVIRCAITYAYIGRLLSKESIGLSNNPTTSLAPFPLIREVLRFGSKLYLGGIFWFLILRADAYMIKHFLSVTELGYYSLGVGLAEQVWLITASIQIVLLPTISRMTSIDDKAEYTMRVIRITGGIIALLGILLILAAPFLITTFYSKQFINSVLPFRLLMIATVAYAIRNLLGEFFVSIEHPGVNIFTCAIALALNIGLNLFFIPQWGIVGAAIASLIAYSLDALLGIMFFAAFSRAPLRKLFFIDKKDVKIVRQQLKALWPM